MPADKAASTDRPDDRYGLSKPCRPLLYPFGARHAGTCTSRRTPGWPRCQWIQRANLWRRQTSPRTCARRTALGCGRDNVSCHLLGAIIFCGLVVLVPNDVHTVVAYGVGIERYETGRDAHDHCCFPLSLRPRAKASVLSASG